MALIILGVPVAVVFAGYAGLQRLAACSDGKDNGSLLRAVAAVAVVLYVLASVL